MATIPITLLNGTTADADQVMDIFTEIYTNIDRNNVTSKTGTGSVFVFQTSPTINTPTLTTPVITGDLNLNSGADLNIYSDAGTTLKFKVDGATGDFGIPSGRKFLLDGTALTGDTYLIESAANQFDLFVGGASMLEAISANALIFIPNSNDFGIRPTRKFFFDVSGGAGGDTYIYESSANRISFVTGGSESFRIDAGVIVSVLNSLDFSIQATRKLYLDNGGDTYIQEGSANEVTCYAGATAFLRWSLADNAVTVFNGDFRIPTTKKLYLDGGANDYWTNSGNGVNELWSNGIKTIYTDTSGDCLVDVALVMGSNKLYFSNIATNTYLQHAFSVTNRIRHYIAGSLVMELYPTQLSVEGDVIPTTNNTYTVGKNGNRWSEIFATNGTINTSDFNLKTNIQPSNLGLKFIKALEPVSFHWKEKDNGRHYGLIAQQVLEALDGNEFSGVRVAEDGYGMVYTELLAPMIKAIQELSDKIDEIKMAA